MNDPTPLTIEDFTPGARIWFVEGAISGPRLPSETDLQEMFLSSATVVRTELRKMDQWQDCIDCEYAIHFAEDETPIYFYVGGYENLNRRAFKDRSDAVAFALRCQEGDMIDAKRELEQAQTAIDFLRERNSQPIQELPYSVYREGAIYMTTYQEMAEKARAATAVV